MTTALKTFAALAGLTFAIAAAGPALAGPHGHGVNARQHNQHHRIEQGARSGQLTRGEAARLNREQRAIRAEERAYRADGRLSGKERADLQRDLNRADRHIYKEKHDAQHRAPPSVRDPGVNARQVNQHERIEQGVRSGELTRGETRQLAAEQRSIRQEERQYKSDGVLTGAERKDLQQDLNAASRNIYSEKHDAERR